MSPVTNNFSSYKLDRTYDSYSIIQKIVNLIFGVVRVRVQDGTQYKDFKLPKKDFNQWMKNTADYRTESTAGLMIKHGIYTVGRVSEVDYQITLSDIKSINSSIDNSVAKSNLVKSTWSLS